MQRAGWEPTRCGASLAAFNGPPERAWSREARIEELLESGSGVLIEVLGRAAKAGVVAPKEHLNRLLEAGSARNCSLRVQNAIQEVLGQRGAWLADLNPQWEFGQTLQETVEEAWSTGTERTRDRAFAKLRKMDPSAARELVLRGFDSEVAEWKCEILAAFSPWNGMSELLLGLLEDRSLMLRQAALRELMLLPGNEVISESEEIVFPLVSLKRSFLQKSLEIDLPAITAVPKGKPEGWLQIFAQAYSKVERNTGWRQHLLSKIVAHTPPSRWEQHLGEPAEAIVRLGIKEDMGEAFLFGVFEAANSFKDASWAAAVPDLAIWEKFGLFRALKFMEPIKAERILISFIEQRPDRLRLLDELPTWSASLSRFFLDRVINAGPAANLVSPSILTKLNPDIYPEASRRFRDDDESNSWSSWLKSLELLSHFQIEIQNAKTQ